MGLANGQHQETKVMTWYPGSLRIEIQKALGQVMRVCCTTFFGVWCTLLVLRFYFGFTY